MNLGFGACDLEFVYIMKLAITNAHIIDPANNRFGRYNIFIENGVIAEVGEHAPRRGVSSMDASGFIAAPGFIDLHVHLREPGSTHSEDIESGSKAALAGGFTSVFCMPNTNPVNDNTETARYIMKRARKIGLINVYPVAALSKGLKGDEVSDIAALAREGVIAVSDDGLSTKNSRVLKKAMEIAARYNILVMTHPENFAITGEGRVNIGVARRAGLPGIPPEAEESIIERNIGLAEETGARLHICHVSTAVGADMVRRAKARGSNISCEVTPHHITLSEEAVLEYGRNAIMKPPLRTEGDRLALIDAINDGTVDAIATDHAPHLSQDSFGIIGLETAFPVCMKLVLEGLIKIEKLVELLTASPAKVAGIKAGSLAEGYPADITVFDPRRAFTIDASRFRSKSRNTPYNGWHVKGKLVHVIAGGRIAY